MGAGGWILGWMLGVAIWETAKGVPQLEQNLEPGAPLKPQEGQLSVNAEPH
jgi:hypothetical protein